MEMKACESACRFGLVRTPVTSSWRGICLVSDQRGVTILWYLRVIVSVQSVQRTHYVLLVLLCCIVRWMRGLTFGPISYINPLTAGAAYLRVFIFY